MVVSQSVREESPRTRHIGTDNSAWAARGHSPLLAATCCRTFRPMSPSSRWLRTDRPFAWSLNAGSNPAGDTMLLTIGIVYICGHRIGLSANCILRWHIARFRFLGQFSATQGLANLLKPERGIPFRDFRQDLSEAAKLLNGKKNLIFPETRCSKSGSKLMKSGVRVWLAMSRLVSSNQK